MPGLDLGLHIEPRRPRYMRALDGALKACTDLPLEAFDRALGSGRYPELDAARTALVAAIAPRASRAAP